MKRAIVIIIVAMMLFTSSLVGINAIELDISVSQDAVSPRNVEPFEGYILFSPWFSYTTYLINKSGEVVNKWGSLHRPTLSTYLLENGDLLKADFKYNPFFRLMGGSTGRIGKFDWNGTLKWSYSYSNHKHYMHHDIEPLPNGNVLLIGWEKITIRQAIELGINPAFLLFNKMRFDSIIEVKQTGLFTGEIVWEWHFLDHVIQDNDPTRDSYGNVSEHPELIDINIRSIYPYDWGHTNSVDYNEELDQILISSGGLSEIYIIDHNTTIQEAAGHTGGRYGKGGDILYRWGNPQNYGAGDENDQKLRFQHDANWIEEGYPGENNILIFNNNILSNYSSVLEIVPPVDQEGCYYLEEGSSYGPDEPIWNYTAENPSDFFSSFISGACRIPNGNTLICHGPKGIFFEVTPENEKIWEYKNKYPYTFLDCYKQVFKIQYYPSNYSGIGNLSKNSKNLFSRTSLDSISDIFDNVWRFKYPTFLNKFS